MLLIEVAKEFVSIIDNKKTDGTSVEAKKEAWMALTRKYNAASETGVRTEKQLHALYDNLKKKARKNLSDDKAEIYKTGGGTFTPKTSAIDEKVVALLEPQFKPLENEFDSSAPYYNIDIEQPHCSSQVIWENKENVVAENAKAPQRVHTPRPPSPEMESTPKRKRMCLTEKKKKNINNISTSMIKRKQKKQNNEDILVTKKLQILDVQLQHEKMKLEKTQISMDLDIELKKTLLENAKMDLELKKKNFSL